MNTGSKTKKETAMSRIARNVVAALVVVAFASPAFAAEVDNREANQQARIAEGVQSGQLTPHETAKLERKEAKIHHEIARDRAANGGKLTPAEKAKINREQNRESKKIYKEKHDAQHM
jgi:hypothetical protein